MVNPSQQIIYLSLDKVTDPHFSHDRDGHGGLDLLDHLGIGHASHTAYNHDIMSDTNKYEIPKHTILPDIGGHALQGHDGAGAGLLGDPGLLGVDDIHDDAALCGRIESNPDKRVQNGVMSSSLISAIVSFTYIHRFASHLFRGHVIRVRSLTTRSTYLQHLRQAGLDVEGGLGRFSMTISDIGEVGGNGEVESHYLLSSRS
ncbi:hypothetical protein BC938DRAFT_484246 [Jimgerdemannia flammicorona]|uniref:Uncharacterized protein n=1 Tax=Jimgerdemannia flammicorona TaxID=994334 RepID=A0A433QA58_9FUNG|nr:hypothetical protein BC938DRAFT_484246 [Jimgerdemannia flammicorona]